MRITPDSLREVKHGGEIAVVSDESGHFIRFFSEDFTDSKGLMGLECAVAHFAQKLAYAGGLRKHAADGAQPVRAIRRIAAEGQGFFDVDDGVDPKAGKSSVQPPVDHSVDFLADSGILPVEIRLLFVEDMQIEPVFVSGQLLPDRPSEIRTPVAGQDIAVGRTYGE